MDTITSKIRHKYSGSYEGSFAYHIEQELGESLDKYWDFDKNTLNPCCIGKNSHKDIWIKCQNKDYHQSYKTQCYHFYNGRRCPYCNTFASNKVHPLDSFGTKYPELAKLIYCDENGNQVDVFQIPIRSDKKYYFKCDKCHRKSSNLKILKNIARRGYSCEYCSDGISIPQKFFGNLFSSLGLEFESEKTFKWGENKRYDFYIQSYNMIIEIHGEQHYKKNGFNRLRRTLTEEQSNDRLKKDLALSNGIKQYIEIDSRESSLLWLKENCIKELGHIFDFKNIDWEYIWELCQSSLVSKSWELWEDGKDLKTIAKILNVNSATVTKYLKKGFYLGLCSYDSKEEMRKGVLRSVEITKEIKSKKIVCLNTKEVFDSITSAEIKYFDSKKSNISSCCKHKRNYCGIHPITNQKLLWMYHDEYISSDEEYLNELILDVNKDKNRHTRNYTKKVVCITTGDIFDSIVNAANHFNINRTHISSCCKGKRGYCGKLENGQHLKWMYYEDYLNTIEE